MRNLYFFKLQYAYAAGSAVVLASSPEEAKDVMIEFINTQTGIGKLTPDQVSLQPRKLAADETEEESRLWYYQPEDTAPVAVPDDLPNKVWAFFFHGD